MNSGTVHYNKLTVIIFLLAFLSTMLGNYTITLMAYLLAAGLLASNYKNCYINHKEFILWKIYFFLIIVDLFRGLYNAEIYFDYKNLTTNFLDILIPLLLGFNLANKEYFASFYNKWLTKGIIFALCFIPFIPGYQVGKTLTAILLISVFFRYIPPRYKIISIALILFGILLNDGSRSLMLRSVIFFVMIIFTYIGILKKFKLLYLSLFALPIILVSLAVFSNFNILEYMQDNDQYSDVQINDNASGDNNKRSINTDTRSFLYSEGILSAIHKNSMLFGVSMSRGHESMSFYGDGKDGTRVGERNKDEVGVLNAFTWWGLVGVLIYSSCFFYSIWLGLYRTKNKFTIYGAVLLLFFWIYSWIEEIQIARWDYMIIFLLVPFVTSKDFRSMSNKDMITYIRTKVIPHKS